MNDGDDSVQCSTGQRTFFLNSVGDEGRSLLGKFSPLAQVVVEGERGFVRQGSAICDGLWSAQGEQWQFQMQESASGLFRDLHSGAVFEVFDYYWGERVFLVLDDSIKWEPVEISPASHHHCAICWAKCEEQTTPSFRASKTDFVCSSCFENYVVPKQFGFIVENAPD